MRDARVRRHSHADYYEAVLQFTNGETTVVPLYVPYSSHDDELDRANEIAKKIGRLAARSGEINSVEWVLDGHLPLREYLQWKVQRLRTSHDFSSGLQFTTSVVETHSNASYHLNLFNGDSQLCTCRLRLRVPLEFLSPPLSAALDEITYNVLGATARRSHLRASRSQASRLDLKTVLTEMPHMRFNVLTGLNATVAFRLTNGRIVTLSLGTKNPSVAKERAEQFRDFIRTGLAERGTIHLHEMKAWMARFKEDPQVVRLSARITRSRSGAVVCHKQSFASGTPVPEEALRVYTTLSGTPATGYQLRIKIVPPHGSSANPLYSCWCAIDSKHDLTIEHADDLRNALREFVETRLGRFYSAGGEWPRRDELVFRSSGVRGLTPTAVDRFHRILQGRFNTAYVNAALGAGVTNPFDEALQPDRVHQLGGLTQLVEPADSNIRFLNTRFVPASGNQKVIRTIIVVTGSEQCERSRHELTLNGVGQIVELVHAIDAWVIDTRLQGSGQIAYHAVSEMIRRACSQYQGFQIKP